MGGDDVVASGWFVLNAGKVYARCGRCHSHRISYYKKRVPGLMGISQQSRGLTPVCLDCSHGLPERHGQRGAGHSRKLDGVTGNTSNDYRE